MPLKSDTEQLFPEYAAPDGTVDHAPVAPHPDDDTTATGDWAPPATDLTADHVPGPDTSALTADFAAPQAPAAGNATIDAPAAPPAVNVTIDEPGAHGAGPQTTDFPSTPQPTGLRGAGGTTGAPSVGAYPPVAPEMRSGRYLLKKFHAKGGMGEVWLAEDCEIGRPVALKKMFSSARPDQQERFLLEAQVTGQLEHPGIVPVHELGIDETGQPFYAMKFIQGQTLKDVIAEYHKTAAGSGAREVQGLRLLQIFLDVCQAVAYAHSRGVIHRDLKPDNVMVGAYGETLLLDWGLAKPAGGPELPEVAEPVRFRISGESIETMDGSIKGTPSYMSPEVAEGRVADVDQVSDIYLLGATLYQILTGKRPRHAKKMSELVELARKQPPTPPRKLDKTIPKPLEAICLKAMAHAKQDRYQTATALAEDVQRYLAGEPVTAYRENWWERTWRWIRRHRVALGRTAAAALVLGGALFAFVLIREAQEAGERAARQAAELQEKQQARDDLKEFRRLADEVQLHASFQDPGAVYVPYYDLEKGKKAGADALALLRPWGRHLDKLPLPEEQRRVKKELYDLLLLLAEMQGRGARQPETGRATLALLDRAAALCEPSTGYYRLRAESYALLGDKAKEAAARKQAESRATPTFAVDHFLNAERLRMKQADQAEGTDEKERKRQGREQLKPAIEQYRKALALEPNHFWLHFQLGHCYLAMGEGDMALEALGGCVALRPESPWGYTMRGLVFGLQKQYPEALADLDRALFLSKPEFRLPRLNRGIVYWQQKDYDKALADFNAVLEPPAELRLLEGAFYSGQLHLERGQEDKALASFAVVAAAKPTTHPVYLVRGRLYLARGDFKNGLKDIDAFLGLDPAKGAQTAAALARRGRQLRQVFSQLPRKLWGPVLRLALNDLERAEKLNGWSVELFDDLGMVCEPLGKVPQAIRAYTAALQLDPKNVPILVKRGWAHEKLSEYKEGLADFRAALALDPGQAEANAGAGYMEACLWKTEAGGRFATRALLHGAGDYLILHNVACIYAKLSERDLKRARALEDMALDLMYREVELWRRDRRGLNPITLLRDELPGFPEPLRKRPELIDLLKPDR